MPVTRKNCIVLDTSILPKRPSVPDIKKFLDEELRLDMTTVKSVQPHNVKNVVYLAMQSKDAAVSIASNHHLKHFMECDGKRLEIPLPIYVESSAVDVRLHDLPEEISNDAIASHMGQYGEVFGIHSEVWKNYFPGLSNGVRVVRMHIKKPIPSYVTIETEVTLVTHFLQTRTCKNCSQKSHPNLRCSEAASIASKPQTQNSTIQSPAPHQPAVNVHQIQHPNNDKQWPSLPKPAADDENNTKEQNTKKQEAKRQRSIESNSSSTQAPKRVASTPNPSDSNVIIVDDSPNRAREVVGSRVRTVSYSWIEDEVERQQLIEEYDRRMEELIQQGHSY